MTAVYKSKVDTWVAVVLAVAIAVSLFASGAVLSSGGPWWVAVAIVAVGAALPLWLLLGTNYRLDSGQLYVRSGPFRWRVPVTAITSIVPTDNAMSSPALSLDRLRIEYSQGKAVMVSPRNKDMFIRDIEAMRHVAG